MTDVGAAPRIRDARIDALRGLAITLVVLGHCLVRATPASPGSAAGSVGIPGVGWVALSTAANPLLDLIYSIHIPLFAFVSGAVLWGSQRGYGVQFLKRRFLGLMVPYFAWMLIGWISVGEKSPFGLLRFMATGAVNPQAPGGLWFLYALFMSAVVLAAVKWVRDSEGALVLSAAAVGLAGIVPVGSFDHFLGLADVAWVYPFFIAGLLFAPRREWLDRRMRVLLPVALVLWSASIPIITPVLVSGPRWWFPWAAGLLGHLGAGGAAFLVSKGVWAAARVAGSLAGVLTIYYAYAFVKGHALGWQAWLGQRSIGIYALQAAFLVPFGEPWGWRHVAILFAIAMTGSILATLVLERFKWTRAVLLGRVA